jgi:hypothetical protein
MMEAANTSETSVNFYQTTRRNSPEDSHLRTRHRENLKYSEISDRKTMMTRQLFEQCNPCCVSHNRKLFRSEHQFMACPRSTASCEMNQRWPAVVMYVR